MKFILAAVAAFLISFALGFIVHGMILRPDYLENAFMYRGDGEAMTFLPYLLLSYAVKAFAFTWVYRQGITAGVPWISQGIRFGIIASLLISIPMCLMHFATQPLSPTLVVKQMVFETIGNLVMALAVAYILKASPQAE